MYSCPAPPDCSIPDNFTIPFEADPDVDGIGMIASFYAAAWLTIVLLAFAFFIAGTTFDDDVFCQLDKRFILRLHQLWQYLTQMIFGHKLPRSDETVQRIRKGLQTAILILSDQQLITGAAISIVGLSRHCNITEYHFNTVINLALCASLAHSLTFPFVEHHVMQNGFFRIWRAIAMLLLGALLMGTWVVTGSNDWLIVYGLPAQCGFDNLGRDFGPPATVSLGILYWFLLRGYLFSLWILMPSVNVIDTIGQLLSTTFWLELICKVVRYVLKYTVSQYQQSKGSLTQISMMRKIYRWTKSAIFLGISTLLLIFFSLVYSIAQCWRSYAFNLSWSCYTLSGSANIIGGLRATAAENGMTGTESDWTFGQQLPMLMLLLPCFAIAEAFFDDESPSAGKPSSPSLSSAQDMPSPSQRNTSGRSSISRDLPSPLMQSSTTKNAGLDQHASVRTSASNDNTSERSFILRHRIDTEQRIGLNMVNSSSDIGLQRLRPQVLQSAAPHNKRDSAGIAASTTTETEADSNTCLLFFTLDIVCLEDELWGVPGFIILILATFGVLSYIMVFYGL